MRYVMRQFNPSRENTKTKKSNFFESFFNSKGQAGTNLANNEEIKKSLRSFYLDLAFGSLVQDKYLQFLEGDPRIIEIAMEEANRKIIECNIILQSMTCAQNAGLNITYMPEFMSIYNNNQLKMTTYTIIWHGLAAFKQSHDRNALASVSVQLNNPSIKGSRQQLML